MCIYIKIYIYIFHNITPYKRRFNTLLCRGKNSLYINITEHV